MQSMISKIREENEDLQRSVARFTSQLDIIAGKFHDTRANCCEIRKKHDVEKKRFLDLFFNALYPNSKEYGSVKNAAGENEFLMDEMSMVMRGGYQYTKAQRISDMEECLVKRFPLRRLSVVKRLNSEIGILKKISLPSILKIYGCWFESNDICIVYECAGESMRSVIDKYPTGMPPRFLHSILWSLVDTLAYAHARSVAHGDLHNENIFVHVDEMDSISIKISGFGSVMDENMEENTDLEMFGSPGFVGPETLNTRLPWDYMKADTWALGCVLNNLILGNDLFQKKWMCKYENLYLVKSESERYLFTDGLMAAKMECSVHWADTDFSELLDACHRTAPSARPAVSNLVRFTDGTWGVLGSTRPDASVHFS